MPLRVLLVLMGMILPVACSAVQLPSPSPGFTPGGGVPTATAPPVATVSTPAPSPTPSNVSLTLTGLKYVLLDQFTPLFFCDPDYYPIASVEGEQKNALAEFPKIRSNDELYQAILRRNHLSDADTPSPEVQLLIYRNFKTLAAIQLQPAGAVYNFQLRTGDTPQHRFMVQGTIAPDGTVVVSQKEPVFGDCPRCLALGTQIDTPNGPIAVQDLKVGMVVWTADAAGNRRATTVLKTARTPVPAGSMLVRLVLDDGRSLLASPAHPSGDRRVLGELRLGDWLDGSRVIQADRVPYEDSATYDILPAGTTGEYWANGILVGSTLKANPGGHKNLLTRHSQADNVQSSLSSHPLRYR